jgi:hypothetical protein
MAARNIAKYGGDMKRSALLILLLLLALCVTAAPAPDEYSVTIHVRSSYLLFADGGASQMLDTVIDGKKYVLSAPSNSLLLALGDYKAKLTKDDHKTSYESNQVYEILFPDKKTRKFFVAGQTE